MAAAQNCVYGSTLSPPRLQQIRECVEEYFEHCTPSDPYFQFYLPQLVHALPYLGVSLSDEKCEKALLISKARLTTCKLSMAITWATCVI